MSTNRPNGGQGGQAAAPGAGGTNTLISGQNGSAGSGRNGGTNSNTDAEADAGGGGGGGYFGGGGGSNTQGYDTGAAGAGRVGGPGGGGGASFIAATSPDGSGTAPTAISSAAGPKTSGSANGADGAVTLDWVPCDYDLRVTKSVSPTSGPAGTTFTWTVAVTNLGPEPMTRGDSVTLADTLPGTGAKTIASIAVSGGSGLLATTSVTCSAGVGAAMPATLTCTRPYSAPSAGGTPSGGTRGLNVGETLTVTYTQTIAAAVTSTLTNTATVDDRTTGDPNDTATASISASPTAISGSVVATTGTGLAGVTVQLRNAANVVIATTTTDASGNYSFSGLAAGTYSVVETQPVGYGEGGQTATWPGANTGTTNVISNIVLVGGSNATGNVFTETYSSLAGSVYHDLNGNGVRDTGEPGIAGVSVGLGGTAATGAAVTRSTTTDAAGNYSFTNLLSGTYAITETQPGGYTDGTDAAGSAGGTAANPGDAITAIALPVGTSATGYTFGEYQPMSIGDLVFLDLNANGARDPGEPGIPERLGRPHGRGHVDHHHERRRRLFVRRSRPGYLHRGHHDPRRVDPHGRPRSHRQRVHGRHHDIGNRSWPTPTSGCAAPVRSATRSSSTPTATASRTPARRPASPVSRSNCNGRVSTACSATPTIS